MSTNTDRPGTGLSPAQKRALSAIDAHNIRFGPAGRVDDTRHLNAAPQATWYALIRAGLVVFRFDEHTGWYERA